MLIDPDNTVLLSRLFQLLITRSEKKWCLKSVDALCFPRIVGGTCSNSRGSWSEWSPHVGYEPPSRSAHCPSSVVSERTAPCQKWSATHNRTEWLLDWTQFR